MCGCHGAGRMLQVTVRQMGRAANDGRCSFPCVNRRAFNNVVAKKVTRSACADHAGTDGAQRGAQARRVGQRKQSAPQSVEAARAGFCCIYSCRIAATSGWTASCACCNAVLPNCGRALRQCTRSRRPCERLTISFDVTSALAASSSRTHFSCPNRAATMSGVSSNCAATEAEESR